MVLWNYAIAPKLLYPDKVILNEFGFSKEQKYIIIRFVSWNASHDIGQKGLGTEFRTKLIYEMSKYAKVLISSESELPENLKPYQIKISPEKMHDVLFFADLYIGEGGTMASESALLGIPTIYVNTLPLMGYLVEEKKHGLLYHFKDSTGVIERL